MKPETAPHSSNLEIREILTGYANKGDLTVKLRKVINSIIDNIEKYGTGPTGCNFNVEMIGPWSDTPALGEIMDEYELAPEEREKIISIVEKIISDHNLAIKIRESATSILRDTENIN
jgi:hypothetical protein